MGCQLPGPDIPRILVAWRCQLRPKRIAHAPLAALDLGGRLTLGGPASAPAARTPLVSGALGLVPFVPGSDAARGWAPLRRAAPDALRGVNGSHMRAP